MNGKARRRRRLLLVKREKRSKGRERNVHSSFGGSSVFCPKLSFAVVRSHLTLTLARSASVFSSLRYFIQLSDEDAWVEERGREIRNRLHPASYMVFALIHNFFCVPGNRDPRRE